MGRDSEKASGVFEESEFKEIGHSGGKVIFHIVTHPDGGRSYPYAL